MRIAFGPIAMVETDDIDITFEIGVLVVDRDEVPDAVLEELNGRKLRVRCTYTILGTEGADMPRPGFPIHIAEKVIVINIEDVTLVLS